MTWCSTRTTTCSRSPSCSTAGSARTAGSRSSATTRWTCSSGRDGDFYLLTYGDGFFNINPDAGMYKWQYVKGQRAPTVGMSADRTDGPVPLTVNFSSAGTSDPIRATRSRSTGTSATAPRTRWIRTRRHVYTTHGRYTVHLTVTDSSGKSAGQQMTITAGNTSPTVDRDDAGRRRHVHLRQRHPVHGDGHRSGGRRDPVRQREHRGHVRARPRHARPRRGGHDRLHRRAAHDRRATSRTAATCSA